MIGDESPWLVNLIITTSLLPILVGTLGEHVGTEPMLASICLLFLVVTLYTLSEGQIVDPPRPTSIDSESIAGETYENPMAVHHSKGGKGASEEKAKEEKKS